MARGAKFSNISVTTDSFTLKNGMYAMSAIATFGGGTVKLSRLAADAATYVDVISFSSAGYDTAYLMNGTYRVTIATATAVYVEIAAVQTGDEN